MFETIKKYKLLLTVVVLTWIVLMSVYIVYMKYAYSSIQKDELKGHLVLGNAIIYNEIGKDYFSRATKKDAIDSKEYNYLQRKVTTILKTIGLDAFTTILPRSDGYYITMSSFSPDLNVSERAGYFTSYMQTYKPTKDFEERLRSFINSDQQQRFCFENSLQEGFYTLIEKKYLPDNRVFLMCLSYEKSKFDSFLGMHKDKEIIQTLLLIASMLPILFYVVFIFYKDREHIKYKSLHNRLTGLKNLKAFMQTKFKQAALLYLDIEFFAEYNRLYGHRIGDKLIVEFASKLRNYIDKQGYKYFAFNGNDFGILIEGLDETDLENEVKKILEYLNTLEVKVNDTLNVILRIKVGAAIATDPEMLFENAHSASSIAKRKGLHYYIYNESVDRKNHLHVLEKLIYAIKNDDITVFYQPIIDVNEQLVKYEALIRFHDNGKCFCPVEFLHIAKMSGHYYDLTMIVLKKVLSDIKTHKIHASFNLSYDDISNSSHASEILYLLSQSPYPEHITVELLESSAIEDFSLLKEFINRAQEIGVNIAIDDYGAEYSSIENILRIKPDFLKIDGSIVKNIVHDTASLTVLSTTTMMAKSLGMTVVAEYVESKEIFDLAKSIGVDMFQGYYNSEPKPLSQFL